jgi:hypothetical protein
MKSVIRLYGTADSSAGDLACGKQDSLRYLPVALIQRITTWGRVRINRFAGQALI